MKKRSRSPGWGKPRVASCLALAIFPCSALLASAALAGQTVTIDGDYSGLAAYGNSSDNSGHLPDAAPVGNTLNIGQPLILNEPQLLSGAYGADTTYFWPNEDATGNRVFVEPFAK